MFAWKRPKINGPFLKKVRDVSHHFYVVNLLEASHIEINIHNRRALWKKKKYFEWKNEVKKRGFCRIELMQWYVGGEKEGYGCKSHYDHLK